MNKFVIKSTIMAALATTLFTGVALADQSPFVPSQILKASDGMVGDGFGSEISICGDYALIGAPHRKQSYIFKKSDGLWKECQILKQSDHVAMSHSYVFVSNNDTVRVYENEGGIWKEKQTIEEEFGNVRKLSSFGDCLLILADRERGSKKRVGLIYKKNNAGLWKKTQELIRIEPKDSSATGVSLSDEFALVTANVGMRAVYVYRNMGNNWSTFQTINAPKPKSAAEIENLFGQSVSTTDKNMLIYSRSHNDDVFRFYAQRIADKYVLAQTIRVPNDGFFIPGEACLSATHAIMRVTVNGDGFYLYAYDNNGMELINLQKYGPLKDLQDPTGLATDDSCIMAGFERRYDGNIVYPGSVVVIKMEK